MTQLAHPVEEGLSRFTLISGVGNGKQTACAMSLLNWMWRNGDDWTDAPDCAHPIIRAAVIAANDAPSTTPEMRAELVRLGERGVLDTWWVPTEVVVASLAAERDAEPPSPYGRAVACLQRVAVWKETRERPYLAGAYLAGAYLAGAYLDGADLAGADLAGAYLAGAYLVRANLVRANLAGANLVGANLVRANLVRANLVRANLDGADLAGADLAGADLAGANLVRASGDAYTCLPAGWKVNDSGIVERDA